MLRISGMIVPLINPATQRSRGEDLNIAQNQSIRFTGTAPTGFLVVGKI